MSLTSDYQSIINNRISLIGFLDAFSNEDECLELYFNLKFGASNCSKCGRRVVESYYRIYRKDHNGVSKKAFRCRSCHQYIYPFSDTVFRQHSVSISNIFFAIYLLCLRGGLSTTILTTHLNISYKTAHRLTMLIRKVLINGYKNKMRGTVEVDEAFLGKGGNFQKWSGISTKKQLIIGLIERDTKQSRLFAVPDRKALTINKIIFDNVEIGSTVYTDSWRGYAGLSKNYTHEIINHSDHEWVRGDVHTNNIESLWGKMKRNLRKNHIKITDKYIQLYINEACWQHNSRGKKTMQLFDEVLRLTFFGGLD